ncbi:hypothetical protein PG988_015117 [Apiospora saccharicola]
MPHIVRLLCMRRSVNTPLDAVCSQLEIPGNDIRELRSKTNSMHLSPLGAQRYVELHPLVSNYIIFVAPGKQDTTPGMACSARRAWQDYHTHDTELDKAEAWVAHFNLGIMRLLVVLAYNQGLAKGLNVPQALLDLVCKNHQRQNKTTDKLTWKSLMLIIRQHTLPSPKTPTSPVSP